ncbi:MAG: SusD/RagB family nutrient-binding outer membrane lipoprotein [Bacteroidales bacterium]|nr:SusD/RagB family nutrient-binding outer membrane lipoprotein [Bacteroidales bacterium]
MKTYSKYVSNVSGTAILSILLLLGSCTKDFEDINTDPQGFTTASDGSLFNSIIQSLIPEWNEMFYIDNEILYKQSQLAALTRDAWGNYTIGTEDIWQNYYTTLPEIRELERRFGLMEDNAATTNMRAMLTIVKALKTFKVTDLFGDIPYSQAGYGFQNLDFLHPAYDTQRDIYLSLLAELKQAADSILMDVEQAGAYGSFLGFDKLFNGDMLQWKKLANSLLLRHAMRMAEKEPEIAGELIADIIYNNKEVFFGYDFITSKLEAACLWPAGSGFKHEGLNWSFREHNNLRMGTTVWQQLSANDNDDGSGIFDPRAYIFFEPNNAGRWIAFPQNPDALTPSSGGIPYGTHRDQEGTYQIKGEGNIYSPFNYFIVRDEDYMPIVIISGAEVHYIKAEAYFRGIGVSEDKMQAEIEFYNGINSSVEWWMKVASNSRLPLSGMKFSDMNSIPAHLNAASVQAKFGFWNTASEEEKLHFIYTQRWIDAFRQPQQAYALARRTTDSPRIGSPLHHFRLPYPPTEAAYNQEQMDIATARQGGDTPQTKLWWIP